MIHHRKEVESPFRNFAKCILWHKRKEYWRGLPEIIKFSLNWVKESNLLTLNVTKHFQLHVTDDRNINGYIELAQIKSCQVLKTCLLISKNNLSQFLYIAVKHVF